MEDLYPDPQALGELITFLFRWMGTAAGKDEETIRARREKIRILQETMQATDFGGVIRDALTRRAETFILSPKYNRHHGYRSDHFANLLNILPPLLNNLLKGGISHGGLRRLISPRKFLPVQYSTSWTASKLKRSES